MDFIPDAEIDFHNFGELLPFDVERILNEFIEDSYVSNHKTLLVITGKGKMVRPEVQKLLNRNQHVEKFKQAGYFNGQSGAFEVWLKE